MATFSLLCATLSLVLLWATASKILEQFLGLKFPDHIRSWEQVSGAKERGLLPRTRAQHPVASSL